MNLHSGSKSEARSLSTNELVFRTVIITLIVVGTILRVTQVFAHTPLDYLERDCKDNLDWACQPKGHSLEGLLHSPGYALFLALIIRISGMNHFLVAVPIAALSAVTPWLFYRWMREFIVDKNIALLGWLAFTFVRTYFFIYSYLVDLTLLLPLTAASLWLTWRAARKATWRACWVAAVICGAAILVKPIVIPAVVLPWFYVASRFLSRMKKRYALSMVAASLLIIVCLYMLWPLRIWANTGAVVIFPHRYTQAHYESGAVQVDVDQFYNRIDGTTWKESAGWTPVLFPPLHPFNSWMTFRQGHVRVEVDYRKGFDQLTPKIRMSWADRFVYTFENMIFWFFAIHWPDDVVQMDQPWPFNQWILDRFMWFPLTAFIFVVVLWKRRGEFVGWYFVALTLVYLFQQSTIIKGWYNKPWQGIVLATFFWVIAGSKWYQALAKRWFAAEQSVGSTTAPASATPAEPVATSVNTGV